MGQKDNRLLIHSIAQILLKTIVLFLYISHLFRFHKQAKRWKRTGKIYVRQSQTKEWTGRDDQIRRVKCPVCKSNQIEDESQISLSYALLLRDEWKKMEIKKIVLPFKQLSPSLAIDELVTATNHYVIIKLAKFISSCFELGNILSIQTDVTWLL